jgi:hypothetical protein
MDAFEAERQAELWIAGSVVTLGSPDLRCRACGAEWRSGGGEVLNRP